MIKYKPLGELVKKSFSEAESGHDWNHTLRVLNNALEISKHEEVDPDVIEIGALLHDIADAKFNEGDEETGPNKALEIMDKFQIDEKVKSHVELIIRNISFKNSFDKKSWSSQELKVLQDADRLDAIGAIGIARAFSFGGFKARPFYDFDQPPIDEMTKSIYKNAKSPTINHFYEKLLKLKDGMHTSRGRQLAQERHDFLKLFLDQFYREIGQTPNWHQ